MILKQFHNPSAEKNCKLFSDFLGVNVVRSGLWNNYDSACVRRQSGCSGQKSHRPTVDIHHLIKTHYG